MSAPFETVGEDDAFERVRAALERAGQRGERVGAFVELGEGRRGYLKGSPLAGQARLRHALRERLLGIPPPRLAEHANLAWLRAHGFRAPRPLAAGLRRRRGLVTFQFLLTEEVAGARTLDRALEGAAPAARRALLAALGRDVARLHGQGFVHRDLYPRNLLVTGPPERGEVWFLDAWRGGARRQLRGPAYDHACLMLEGASLLSADEQRAYLEAALTGADRPRLLAAVARERTGLVRRFGAEARDWSPPGFPGET